MPISQIIAADFSTIPFTGNYATETISQTGDGFSAYLARIMDTQYQPAGDDPYDSSHTPEAPKEQKSTLDDSLIREKESDLAQRRRDELTDTVEKPGTRKPGAPAAADLKKKSAASSIAGESQVDSAISGAHAAGAGIVQSAAGSSESNLSLAVGDKPGKGQIAEIDVVLENQKPVENAPNFENLTLVENPTLVENSSRPALKDLNGPAVRGRQVGAARDRKGVSAASSSDAADRAVTDTAPEDRPRAGRKTKIVVRDLRGRGARADGAGNRASELVKGADGSATGPISGNDSQSSADHSFTALLGAKSGSLDASAPRVAEGTINLRTNPGLLNSLRQTLNDQVNGEIVRTARLVVRGNDTGEIRLHLKPENLGNVRIILQMKEGHIAGRIIVENSSVREVFEQNLASLLEAFNESGLETGTLDVALANSEDGSQGKSDGGHAPSAIRELDRAVPLVEMLDDDHDLVDLVV